MILKSILRNNFLFFLLFLNISSIICKSEPIRSIHIIVSLCDNKNQGIVPVPEKLGDGYNPENNLYWGAAFGIKRFFMKDNDWKLLKEEKRKNGNILERCIFRNQDRNVYLLADAYQGSKIKEAISDFLNSIYGNKNEEIFMLLGSSKIKFGIYGNADLIIYVGHNGLMDFNLPSLNKSGGKKIDAMIFACLSKKYFYDFMKKSNANPILWTNSLMAPEAYSIKAAIDGWLLNESGESILERAAIEYSKYQKCSIKSAKRVFSTSW